MHFDIFPETLDIQCCKTNFTTEVCSCSGCSTGAVLWIIEVDVAKSVDDLMTSQAIEGHALVDFEMLAAKIASALKRIITNQKFRRRANVQEQHAPKNQQISMKKTDCLYDLRTFSSYRRS